MASVSLFSKTTTIIITFPTTTLFFLFLQEYIFLTCSSLILVKSLSCLCCCNDSLCGVIRCRKAEFVANRLCFSLLPGAFLIVSSKKEVNVLIKTLILALKFMQESITIGCSPQSPFLSVECVLQWFSFSINRYIYNYKNNNKIFNFKIEIYKPVKIPIHV